VLHRHGIPNEHQIAEIPGDEGYYDDLTDEEILPKAAKTQTLPSKKIDAHKRIKSSFSEKTMDPLNPGVLKSNIKSKLNEYSKRAIKVISVRVS
jgi:hypothetical protein